MNKLVVLLLVMTFIFPIVNADLGSYKAGECVTLKTILDSNSVNISTISYPNSTIIVSNVEMSQTDRTFTYEFCDTYDSGLYIYDYYDNESNYYVNSFTITPTGFLNTLGFYILILVLSIGIIILGYYIQDAWVVILGAFGLVLVGLFILFYGIDGLMDSAYSWGIGIITLMLGAYFGVKAAIEKIEL